MAKQLKSEIKYCVELDEDQKQVARDIWGSQIVVVNGRAGSGKTLVVARTALDMLFKKEFSKVYITRVNVETGRSMGYLPGEMDDKLNPYLQGFKDNVYKAYADDSAKREKLKKMFDDKTFDALPIAYIRGLTVDEILVVEEVQNCTIHEVKAILTRLGKNGKILFTGDFDQCDINDYGNNNALRYLKDLSKAIPAVKFATLKNNHRSDLVQEILDWDYAKNKTND